MRKTVMFVWLVLMAQGLSLAGDQSEAQTDRVETLERRVDELTLQLQTLETGDKAASGPVLQGPGLPEALHIGGYGEMHANFIEGGSGDAFDLHRIVIYLGYDFADWVKLRTETEIEHAFVSDDSGGEVVIEQAYFDFLLSPHFNIRAGRVLTPLGITNLRHEPTVFNGVERPFFDQLIIPTTWSSDGLGFFGNVTREITYQVYIVGGLDGSRITALKGLRDARIKERPSLNDPALTGRVDYMPGDGALRLGASAYAGGLDNANKGADPGIDGEVRIYSVDFEYSVSRFDFRGAAATVDVSGAREIGNGAPSEIFGWYLEGACHLLPGSWKSGRLEKADAVAFVRYDSYDTQKNMPSGVAETPAGDRSAWTVGAGFYPVPNVVLKADYQFLDDKAAGDPENRFNLGVGWVF